MIVLTETTDSLQVVLGGAITTNQLRCVSSWRDITTTAYTPGRTVTNTNNTTDVNLVGSPASSTQRVVDLVNIYNTDTAAAVVTVKFDANGTEYVIAQETLQPGESLEYHEGAGFAIRRIYQPLQIFQIHGDAGVPFPMTNATQAERFAGNTTRHLFTVDLLGYKQVRMVCNVQTGSASVNTPLFRAKYYTSYNTTVGNFLQLGASSQVQVSVVNLAYIDTGWLDLASSAKANGICIGFTEVGGDGVADPALGHSYIMFR